MWTHLWKKNWGLYIKFFEKFSIRKFQSHLKWGEIKKKFDFRQIFHNKLYFFMSNLNSECSQVWFGIHIVHIAQKMAKLRFSPMNFSRSTLVTLAPPYGKSMQHRRLIKQSACSWRCQLPFKIMSGWFGRKMTML